MCCILSLIKNRYQKIALYLRCNPWLVFLCPILTIGIAIVLGEVSGGLFTILRRFIESTMPAVLDWRFFTKCIYEWGWEVIIIAVVIVTNYFLIKLAMKNIVIRDKKYIMSLFGYGYYGAPAPKRSILVENICGRVSDEDTKKFVSGQIDRDVDKIKDFLNRKSDGDVLGINSRWGSGKTTSVLIAINETRNDKNRYIYESTFKYSNNIGEYISDILMNLKVTMREIGILKWLPYYRIDDLAKNLDSSIAKTFTNMIKTAFSPISLSTDIVCELNKRYHNSRCKKIIYIIIDDLDRLTGKDLIPILSLLSILRRLIFVKVIIPADYDVLVRILEKNDVVDSQRFIEKYLPAQRMISLNSGYDLAIGIILRKLFHAQKKWDKDTYGAAPALAAIFLRLLANKLKSETKDMDNVRYSWLPKNSADESVPKGMNEVTTQILRAPKILQKYCDDFWQKYSWRTYYNNISRFEDILVAMDKKMGKTSMRLLRVFEKEDYIEVINSWIFDYMRTRWEIFGFTIRDLLDILNSIDYSNLPKETTEQFVYVFNQLFPENKIEILK